jgi:hypothetical protein
MRTLVSSSTSIDGAVKALAIDNDLLCDDDDEPLFCISVSDESCDFASSQQEQQMPILYCRIRATSKV